MGRRRFDVTAWRNYAGVNPKRKTTVEQRREILRRLAAGESIKALAEDTGLSQTTLRLAKSGGIWADAR